MTTRCQLCGEFKSENTDILSGYDVCFECISLLIENERNGEARDVADLADGGESFQTRQTE